MRETGIVRWFSKLRGYGFIAAGNQELFVHFSDIEMSGYKELLEGQQVSFERVDSRKGPKAVCVRVELLMPA